MKQGCFEYPAEERKTPHDILLNLLKKMRAFWKLSEKKLNVGEACDIIKK